MKKLVLQFLAVLISLLALGGCGGGGGDDAAPPIAGGLLGGAKGATPSATLNYGDTIFLKSAYFRQYASARDGGSVAQALRPLQWEQWKILPPNGILPATTTPVKYNDPVVLKSSRSTYLSAQQGDRLEHVSKPQAWEVWKFQDQKTPASTATMQPVAPVALKSAAWNTYLSARQGAGAAHVSASNTWELWNMTRDDYVRPGSGAAAIHYGDVITARSSFRTYLSAQQGKSVQLADHPESWEKWEVVNPKDWASTAALKFKGPVALYAVDKGTFLSAQNNGYAEQVAQALEWEEWTIVDPKNDQSTAAVEAIDNVALRSSWNTYLSAQQTVAKHVRDLAAWEKWIIAPYGYFANWMGREAARADAFGKKPLREITLPASHDAGTWWFKSEISNDPEAVAGYMKVPLDTVAAIPDLLFGEIGKVKIAGYSIPIGTSLYNDLKQGLLSAVYDTLRPLSQATRRDIAQQLSDGVRWLDLRIDLPSGGGAYTYHFLRGVDMAGVLNDVAAFLKSSKGEIVVLEMSHFTMDLITKEMLGEAARAAKYNAFADMVDEKLGAYKYKWAPGLSPFSTSYDSLIGAAPQGSKVIIIMDDIWEGGPNVHDRNYWTSGDLALRGSYANKSGVEAMINDQIDKFNKRNKSDDALDFSLQPKVFKLYMTLTGQKGELVARTLSGIAGRFAGAVYDYLWAASLGPLRYVPGVQDTLRNWVSGTVSWAFSQVGLSIEIFDWNSLWDLSQKVNPDMHTLMDKWFLGSTNEISVVYADFIDTTFLTETAIRYSRLPKKTP